MFYNSLLYRCYKTIFYNRLLLPAPLFNDFFYPSLKYFPDWQYALQSLNGIIQAANAHVMMKWYGTFNASMPDPGMYRRMLVT